MLGYPSAGPAAEAVAYLPRLTNAPRDEFFWMCQIDKASIISNHEEHLISDQQAARFAQGLQKNHRARQSCRQRPPQDVHPL